MHSFFLDHTCGPDELLTAGAERDARLYALLHQYLYFCTRKASKLSTCCWHGPAISIHDVTERGVAGVKPVGSVERSIPTSSEMFFKFVAKSHLPITWSLCTQVHPVGQTCFPVFVSRVQKHCMRCCVSICAFVQVKQVN